MGPHFIDGEWESLCSMLTFEDPNFDYLGISNNSINLSIRDNQKSDIPSYSFSWNSPSYDNSHLRPFSHSAKFSPAPENEVVFGSRFLLDNLINEPEDAEDSRSGYLGSPNSPDIESNRKFSDAFKGAAPKKKARISKYEDIRTKCEEEEEEEEDVPKAESHTQISDDHDKPNASQETSHGENSGSKEQVTSATSKGHKRASRGEATNPQSLYARKRRQKINERLRILQNLVPNGTKVDISTMLEEALHYVKFLQLQIKLLSSDDLWMYAPIAYNGVDINQYRAISPFLL